MYTPYGIWADKTKSFVSNELVERKKLRIAEKADVILVAAGETIEDIGLGTAWLGNEGVVIHDACFFYKSQLNPKYVACFTRTKQFHSQIKKHISSGKILAVNAKRLSKAKVPIPCPDDPTKSLEIQTDIVRILDALTALTARKKQYNYYRAKLLSFEEGEVEWKDLSHGDDKVVELKRGRVMSKGYLTENAGDYPVYSSQTANNGEIGKINTFDFEGEFISWTTDGANAGTVFYRTGKFSITNVCGLITIINTEELNYKFLFYWLSIVAKKHVYSGMGNPKL